MFFVAFFLSVLVFIWQQNITRLYTLQGQLESASDYSNLKILLPVMYINDRFLHKMRFMWLAFLLDISFYIIFIALYLGYYVSIDSDSCSIIISLKLIQ